MKSIKFSTEGLDIKFSIVETKSLPDARALYIIDMEELFYLKREEVSSILTSIERLITSNFQAKYFQMREEKDYKFCAKAISKYNKNSPLIPFLLNQKKNKYNLKKFFNDCQDKNIKNVYLGGVYGTACVFEAGRRYAKNIYSKILPDRHPNVRFFPKEIDFSFENAIILPEITQGHSPYSLEEKPFDTYVCFQPLQTFSVSFSGDFNETLNLTNQVEKIEESKSKAGLNYQKYLDEVRAGKDNMIYNLIFQFTASDHKNEALKPTEKNFWRSEKIRILKLKMLILVLSFGESRSLASGIYLLAIANISLKSKIQDEAHISKQIEPMKDLIHNMLAANMSQIEIDSAFDTAYNDKSGKLSF